MMIELKHNNGKESNRFCHFLFFPSISNLFFVVVVVVILHPLYLIQYVLPCHLVFWIEGEDDLNMWVMIVY